jgi:nicotinamidase-related amidase
MQEGFRYPLVEKIIPNIKQLIQAYGENTIFLQFENKEKSWFEKVLKWKKFQDKKDRKIVEEFASNGKKIIKHHTYDIFTPELLVFLKKEKAERIVLCGVYTDVSIQMAALKAFDMELPAAIVKDACVSQHSQTLHRAALKSLTHSIGEEHLLTTRYLTRHFPNNKGPKAAMSTKRMR